MANPVFVEVMRGDIVESRHRGAFAIVDVAGQLVEAAGDHARPVFPRSAVKAIQALPLVESGAADAFGFGDAELALACASHSGEPAHAELAASMLKRAGLSAEDMECGVHWPLRQEAALDLARSGGTPSQLHNNCSGKHSGFLCTCRHLGIGTQGYVGFDHPAQQAVRDVMEAVTGAAHTADDCAVDGCSIPTYAVPLGSLARGFARMATGEGLGRERAAAAKRLMKACCAQPFFMAGTGTADVALLEAGAGRLFVKTGAEGVYCGALPELGLGFALKCDDGAGRAAESMVAALIVRLLAQSDPLRDRLLDLANPAIFSRRGNPVGRIRPSGVLG